MKLLVITLLFFQSRPLSVTVEPLTWGFRFPYTSDSAIRRYVEGIMEVKAGSCIQYLSVQNLKDQIRTGFVLGEKL